MNDQCAVMWEEALELLSLLVTSARGLVAEPKEYGPRRLLAAATKLTQFMLPRADAHSRVYLLELEECAERVPTLASQGLLTEALDAACELTGRELVRQALKDGVD